MPYTYQEIKINNGVTNIVIIIKREIKNTLRKHKLSCYK